MENFHLFAAVSAIGYATAAFISKRALMRGAGVLRLSFVINWSFVVVFAVLLRGHIGPIPWGQLHLPLITGFLFFLGQVFTFAAIRFGDVSLQTPVMGTKAVFAVILAVFLGTEAISFTMAMAAVVSMLGIALLGFSGDGVERVGRTLCLALLSSFFFAGSDTMVGFYAGGFGVPLFLFVAILANALFSLGLVPFFREPFSQIPRATWPWILGASMMMALQALLLNYTLATYQNVAAVNVIYTTRGLWTVLLSALAVRIFAQSNEAQTPKRIFVLRLGGACLMTLAIAILFSA